MKSASQMLKAGFGGGIILLLIFTLVGHIMAQTCVQPPTGLVSWWPGDGNADDIVGANQGTLMNGATVAPGMVGQAFNFDGVDSFVQATTTGLPTGNANRTLEMWVKIDAFVADEAFFAGYGSFGSETQTYAMGTVGTDEGNNIFFSSWGPAILGPPLEPGRWYHVAVTNVGNFVTLYLDGTAVSSDFLSLDTPEGTQFYMGKVPGPLGDSRRLQGLVDEVAIYDRALTSAEIQSIFTAGSAGKGKCVGGSLTGLSPQRGMVICQNLTTHKTVRIPLAGATSWNCGDAGLEVQSGDKIQMDLNVSGTVD